MVVCTSHVIFSSRRQCLSCCFLRFSCFPKSCVDWLVFRCSCGGYQNVVRKRYKRQTLKTRYTYSGNDNNQTQWAHLVCWKCSCLGAVWAINCLEVFQVKLSFVEQALFSIQKEQWVHYSPPARWGLLDFYQSCSSPSSPSSPPLPPPPPSPPPPLPPLPCSLPPCQLFAKLFANFCTQWALLDLNCKGLSALGTASELSEHRWTSTWDLPSSVSTAGPQRPDKTPEDMPDRTPEGMPDRMSDRMPEGMPDKVPECLPDRTPEDLPDRMPEDMPDRAPEDMPGRMPEDMPDKMPEDMSDRMPEDMPERMPEGMPDRMSDRMPEGMPDRMSDRMPEGMPDKVPECLPEHQPEDLPDRMPDRMSEDMPEDMPDRVPEDMPEHIAEDMPGRMPDRMPEDMPDKMPEDMSDRMPEDLPVTKRIDVFVGITRSKVIFMFNATNYPRIAAHCFQKHEEHRFHTFSSLWSSSYTR